MTLIRELIEMKVYILYVMSRLSRPVDFNTLWELLFVDDSVSYFDFCESLHELEYTEHLTAQNGNYTVTDKGKTNGGALEYMISGWLKRAADPGIWEFNRRARRDSFIKTGVEAREDGCYTAVMGIDDDIGNLITIQLMTATQDSAEGIVNNFRENAEQIFKAVLEVILNEYDKADS